MPHKDDWGRTCGYLHINEEEKKKKFEKRYFILNKLHGHLEWYTNNPLGTEVVELCGIINLDYITIVDEAKKMKPNYCFVINTIHQSHYVQASSQREMEEWVHIINDASKIIVPLDALIHRPLYDVNEQADPVGGNLNSSSTLTEIVGNVVVKKKLSECRKPTSEHSVYRRSNTTDLTRSLTDGSRDHSNRTDFDAGYKHKNVVKKGWVAKQNRARKTFKSRFVVLMDDGFVYYKSDRMSKSPLNHVAVKEILGAKAEDEETTYLYDNMVIVITLHKIFYFQAESRDEMHSWVNAFNNTVREAKKSGKAFQDHHHVRQPSLKLKEIVKSSRSSINKRRSSLFPVVPVLSSLSMQVSYQQSSPVGGSTEELDEPHPALTVQASKKHRRKHSLPFTSGKSTHLRCDSFDEILETVPDNSLLPDRRRSPNAAKKTAANREAARARVCSTEEGGVNKPPELTRVQSMLGGTGQTGINHHKPVFRKTSSDNFVLTHLDPQVDNRAALKPSLLKKKKTLGILFSFNTMLSKKREKIQKETAKYKSEQEKSLH